MSEENLETTREVFAAFQRGDIGWIVERCDPAVEIVQPSQVPDSKTYRGHAGVRETFEDWPKQWSEFRAELLDVIDAGDSQTISVSRHYLSARGIDMEQEVAYLNTFQEGGLFIRVEMFFTREEALKAAGLAG